MAKFTGTSHKDNFKGGSGNDVFYFDTKNLSSADKLIGGGGTDALVLYNTNGSAWATVTTSQWKGLSSIDGVALVSQSGAYGFKLNFDNSFYTTNKAKQFEIYATGLSGAAQGLHVSASAVKNMNFKIDGSLGGEDALKTGAGNDTFVYIQDAFNVRDSIDAGAGVNTLVFAGAGAVTQVKDGHPYTSPNGHSYLADVKNIDNIVVTGIKSGQSRSIEFGNLANTAHYTGSGVVTIATNQNYGTTKAAAAVTGELIVDGSRLTSKQILHVTGGTAADHLVTGDGNDRLSGGSGNDVLISGKGNDSLSGGYGNDTLTGGLGGDTMSGGAGNDIFYITDSKFGSTLGQFYKDNIDGGSGKDILVFTSAASVNISAKSLAANKVEGIEVLQFANASHAGITLNNTFLAGNHDADGYLHIVGGSTVPTGASGGLSIDASSVTKSTYAIDVEIHSVGTDKLKGGAGDDVFDFAGNLRAANVSGADFGDSISGGGGKDTILVYEGMTAVFGPHVSSMETIKVVGSSKQSGSVTSVDIGSSDSLTIDGRSLGSQDTLIARGFATNPDTNITVQETGTLTLLGGAGNDTLAGGINHDVISGGAGNDLLYGRAGGDTLTGGKGSDLFVFSDLNDSKVSASGSDKIKDFSHADGDKIFFLHAAGGSSFNFIEDASFGHHSGEVRYEFSGSNTLVQLDATGDGVADFQIVLSGKIALTTTDFYL